MKRMKQMLAVALALVLGASCLAGCSSGEGNATSSAEGAASAGTSEQTPGAELGEITDPYVFTAGLAGDTVVARVGEYDVTAAEVLYWLNGQVESYMQQFRNMGYSFTEIPWDAEMGEETLEDTILNSALETAAFYRLIPELGERVGLELSQEEIDFPMLDLEMSAQGMGGEETLRHWLWFRMMDEDLYIQLSHNGAMFEKLQDYYYGPGGVEYPADEEVRPYAEEAGYYRVKHILLKTAERVINADGTIGHEALPEDVAAEKEERAKQLLEQLADAQDIEATFDELMHTYSEDPGLAASPDGYQTYPGQMVAAFEEASLALEEGQISDLVKSDDGYHIILRLPLDLEPFRSQLVSQMMDAKIMGWLEEYGVETLPAYGQIDPSDVRGRFITMQEELRAELEAALAALNEQMANS